VIALKSHKSRSLTVLTRLVARITHCAQPEPKADADGKNDTQENLYDAHGFMMPQKLCYAES